MVSCCSGPSATSLARSFSRSTNGTVIVGSVPITRGVQAMVPVTENLPKYKCAENYQNRGS